MLILRFDTGAGANALSTTRSLEARVSPSLKRGIVGDLRRGSGKSRQGEIAVLWRKREPWGVKTNQYRKDSEPFNVLHSANDTVDGIDQGAELDRTGGNRVFRVGNSPSGSSRGSSPVRTLIVCFTIWLIATQAMIFDQLKFKERAQLLDETARSFGVPQVVVPNQRPSNLPSGAKVQRL